MPTLDESVRPLSYRAHSSGNFTRFEFAGQVSFESVIPPADGDGAVDDTVDTTCNAISGLDVVCHGRDGGLKEGDVVEPGSDLPKIRSRIRS